MAFPDGWRYRARINIDSPFIDSNAANFTFQIDNRLIEENNIQYLVSANPRAIVGGEIRASLDRNGSIELPIYVSYSILNGVSATNSVILVKRQIFILIEIFICGGEMYRHHLIVYLLITVLGTLLLMK